MKPPPVILLILYSLLMLTIKIALPVLLFQSLPQQIVAALLTVIGASLIISGGIAFKRANTTVNPIRPEDATALVRTGIYRISRNPMYLGFLFILSAWGIFLGSLPALVVLPLFIWTISKIQILPEERILKEKFGAAYEAYMASVRRWL